ncbi:aspartate/glutamate racemase family protein [Sinorhizobium psoraleae]|uniref:Aspartate/glutamate racemase family protein n=1 Tax=Sinorhizobium psoraleae TaxID=520838 RepID=A0ABT4K9G6_9HYPH|nr:aspartate/glutamate racemase family protein [Sinorhizobium psoraleae]MCZ4088596.1 aspartate/glutamate racemase family protein [Sinorhizobium psoraleae]
MTKEPRIALIHATPIAIDPIRIAFDAAWPGAERVNILEDSLSPDRARDGAVTDEMADRILALARYARMIGSDAALFTCSSFGSAIEQAASILDIPVLKPNEAMFEAAIRKGGRTAMLYTFPPARDGMESEFREEAARVDPSAEIESFFVEGAIEAVRAGDEATHNRLVAEAAARIEAFDAITLAHFSTARALHAVQAVTTIPVLTSPDAAVAKLRRLLG